MSDSQKAQLALTLLIERCKAASTGLSEDADGISNYPTSDFLTLRTDFLSILSIIYAATTKVALSLKPSAPHPKAALVPLKDLTSNVAALVHSIRLMRIKGGVTVLQEYEKVARTVIDAVRSLGITLQSGPATNGSTEEYLVRTGEIHELIDTVKKSGGLSMDNRDAVRRILSRNQDSLTDAAEEIQEICDSSSVADSHDEGRDDFDDGWAELGVIEQKLSPLELAVADKVQALVKIALLLHKRVIKDIIPTTTIQNASLDTLATSSEKLVIAFDDLISSLYSPQQASNITTHLELFRSAVAGVRTGLALPQAKTLDEQLAGLSVSTSTRDKVELWFSTCFDQLAKASSSVTEAVQKLEAAISE